ncbi:MAG: arylesterase [Salaquimonas sp.]|jgi:acyl-CoA thioesterase-1|nr:arylesterase [Salaquimonas sp.]
MRFKVRKPETFSESLFAGAWLFAVLTSFILLFAGQANARDKPVKLVVLGDSLVAGYGLDPGQAFPEKLEAALRAKGYQVDVVNAGVSGDTSAGGLERLDWSVPEDSEAAIVELGANDALRGIDPQTTHKNLDAIIGRLKARGITVLLAGMLAPPNMGPDYEAAFDPIYGDLAKAHDVALYPFFLDGVAAQKSLNQADGMHPNPAGVDVIVARFLPAAEKLVQQAGKNAGEK